MNMMRSIRNSHRIARHGGRKGGRPLVGGQSEDENLTTDLPSQPKHWTSIQIRIFQQGPANNVVKETPDRNGQERIIYGSHVLLL